MIWQIITRKKCRRHLYLIELLNQERYSIKELAKQTGVSQKTILRDLHDLQQKNYVKKEKLWEIDWRPEMSYARLYREILMADPNFQLFQQCLWSSGCESKEENYGKYKELNQRLIQLNLSVNRQTGRIEGETALIVHLQLRFIHDFYKFDEGEVYRQLALHYRDSEPAVLKQDLFPDRRMLEKFRKTFNLEDRWIEFLFLDYLRYNYPICSDFFLSHQQHQTKIYHEINQVLSLVEEVTVWETEWTRKIFENKLFELFLGIYQGLPLKVFNSYWQEAQPSNDFLVLCKELKRMIPILSNCRLDELATSVKNILLASHHVALSLNPDLKTSLLIQERSEAFLPAQERN